MAKYLLNNGFRALNQLAFWQISALVLNLNITSSNTNKHLTFVMATSAGQVLQYWLPIPT